MLGQTNFVGGSKIYKVFFLNKKNKKTKIVLSQANIKDTPFQRWKTYERASNACFIFFLARVKLVPNCMLFCRKNEVWCVSRFVG